MSDSAQLSAAQRSKIRRLSAPHEPAPGEEAGELNIVPYLDIIMNILMFVLATVAVTFIATIDTTPPAVGGGNKVRADVVTEALNLSAWITNDGISLKTTSGNIAPGCQGIGAGVTVPKVNGEHDFKGVTECAKRLKTAKPAFKDETQVTLLANSDVDYKTVIATMDALRSSGEDALFPDVHFGVAR